MSRPAQDSAGDQAPGWTPQTSPQAAECCSHCLLTASRYIGPQRLCDACYDYQKRTGRPRPQHLIDRAEHNRYEREARNAELEYLKANCWPTAPNTDEWDARRHRHGAPR